MDFLSSSQLYLFQIPNKDQEDSLSANEKKYGKNDLDHLQLCPRCNERMPVRVKMDFENRRVRWYCRKCEFLGHTDGALIREWDMADYCRPEFALPAIRIFESRFVWI